MYSPNAKNKPRRIAMRIRITKIPHANGEKPAPEWVRECWVGLRLEISDILPNDFCVVTGKKTPPGYKVAGAVALQALKLNNKMEAHKWWMDKHPELASQSITFCKDVCKEIGLPEMTNAELLEEWISRTMAYYVKDVVFESTYHEEKAMREVMLLLVNKGVPLDLIAIFPSYIENKVRAERCIADTGAAILAAMPK